MGLQIPPGDLVTRRSSGTQTRDHVDIPACMDFFNMWYDKKKRKKHQIVIDKEKQKTKHIPYNKDCQLGNIFQENTFTAP